MSKLLFKQVSILSAIFGVILGIWALIPVVRNFAVIAVILLLAPIVIIYLKKLDILKSVSVQNGMIIGTISGIVSMFAFILTFTPFDLLFSLFIKDGYLYWIASLIKNAGFFVYFMLIIFIALLGGLVNAFSGLATAYLYDFLGNMKDE